MAAYLVPVISMEGCVPAGDFNFAVEILHGEPVGWLQGVVEFSFIAIRGAEIRVVTAQPEARQREAAESGA